MKKMFVVCCLTISASALAEPRIVYGEDNRIEPYQASKRDQRLAKATAGMLESVKIVETKTHAVLPPATIQSDMGLCADERFAEQPSAVICSGFLVAPDLLVTAGHCVTNQQRCEEVSWVFDYKIKESTKRADIMVPKSKVYKCAKVIESKLESYPGDSKDYALVKLDRPVRDRAPLNYRKSGKIRNSQEILVIGHPSGLPTKVAADAQVFDNSAPSFFTANLDTFGGNSGSAVFDAQMGTVEGILVRGAKDYYGENGCARVFEAPQNIEGQARLGESVSRITDIKALMAKDKLLAGAASGDLSQLNEALGVIGSANITDDAYNSALHIAVNNYQTAAMDRLIAAGADVNHKNFQGESALHRAAFVNNPAAAAKLIMAGADVLLTDKFGSYASGRTNYLAFGLRSQLRKAEFVEKRKRAKSQ